MPCALTFGPCNGGDAIEWSLRAAAVACLVERGSGINIGGRQVFGRCGRCFGEGREKIFEFCGHGLEIAVLIRIMGPVFCAPRHGCGKRYR